MHLSLDSRSSLCTLWLSSCLKEDVMEKKIATTDPKGEKRSLLHRIKCWFTKESSCGGAEKAKPSGDASSESKDAKICSNGEIRL